MGKGRKRQSMGEAGKEGRRDRGREGGKERGSLKVLNYCAQDRLK